MNWINNSKSSANTTGANKTNAPVKSVETAGSLAMNNVNPFAGLFSTPLYDIFSSSNPFAVDYSMYSDFSDGATLAYDGGFLGGFATAYSTITSDGGFSSGFSDGGFSGGFSAGGFSDGGCSSGGCGGFTSVC